MGHIHIRLLNFLSNLFKISLFGLKVSTLIFLSSHRLFQIPIKSLILKLYFFRRIILYDPWKHRILRRVLKWPVSKFIQKYQIIIIWQLTLYPLFLNSFNFRNIINQIWILFKIRNNLLKMWNIVNCKNQLFSINS